MPKLLTLKVSFSSFSLFLTISKAARDALVAYINSTCCWGSDPAKKAEIETELWSSVVCQLETFIEYRVAGWEEKPYRNEHYTALGSGYAPQPWELQAQPIPHFQPSTEVLEVPFTSTIQDCHECNGRRKIRCTNCGGDGKIRCNHCGGDGRVTRHEDGEARQERCDDCGGDGKKKCRYRGYISLSLSPPPPLLTFLTHLHLCFSRLRWRWTCHLSIL
jgi:hypothetical protein